MFEYSVVAMYFTVVQCVRNLPCHTDNIHTHSQQVACFKSTVGSPVKCVN